jgi:hypothetical protein
MGIERYGYRQELSRSLGFTDLLVYGLVFMVPIAPFGIFGGVFAGSGGIVALTSVIGMVAMMFTALSYSEMSRAFPMAGSVYTYAGRGIGAPVGFLCGWMILLDYVLVPGLLYLIASIAMHSLVAAVPVWLWLAGFVVLNTVVNYLGIEMTARVNKVMLTGELLVLAVFLAVGVWALADGRGRGFDMTPLFNGDTFSWGLVFGAVSIAVLSFLGFDGISMLAEENKDSARALGRSMVAALLLAGALFVAQTWVAALLVPDPDRLISEGDPGGTAFYDAARTAAGGWLATLTAAATAIAWGFANSLVAQAATSRLLFAGVSPRAPRAGDGKGPAAAALPGEGAPHPSCPGQRHPAQRGRLPRPGPVHAVTRRRRHAAEHPGQLRRHDVVPRTARLRRGAPPGAPAQPRLLAAPDRPRDRFRHPGVRRRERGHRRPAPRLRLARDRRRAADRPGGRRPPPPAVRRRGSGHPGPRPDGADGRGALREGLGGPA